MWTLIIITIAFSGALSGASSSIAYLDFTDQSKCEAAATAIGAPAAGPTLRARRARG